MTLAHPAERSANGSIIIRFCLSVLLLLALCFQPTPALAQVRQIGSVSGFVLDQAGNRVRNATVLAKLGPDAGRRTTTGIDGSYLLFNLTAGSYVLSASAPGLGTDERNVVIPGGATARVDFVLPTPTPVGGTVEGRVTDRNTGRPVPNATVELSGFLNVPTLRVLTNAAGFYRFDNLPVRSQVRLAVSRVGYFPQARRVTVRADAPTIANFALSPRGSEQATLTGRVTDTDGQPIRNARVTLLIGASAGASDLTDRFGNYRITGILPDIYDIQFSASGFATEVANNVTLQGGITTRFNAVLTPEGEFNAGVEGVVEDTLGTPIEGARVRIISGPGGIGRFDFTGPFGDYSLLNLPPGSYTLEVSATGFVTQTVFVQLVNGVIIRQDIRLVSSGADQFGAITGTVRNAFTGVPLPNVLVQVTSGPITGQSVLTDGSGNYTFSDLPPGLYTLMFSLAGFDTLTVPDINVTTNETSVVNVSLTETTATTGDITGVVRNARTGAVLAGVTVEALRNGTVAATTTTNTQGRFTFSSLTTGTYILRFTLAGFQTLTQSATVQQGVTTTVNVQLQPSGTGGTATIRGQVVDQENQPIAQATVELSSPSGTRAVTTNAQGQFVFANVTPNVTYALTISATGFETERRTNLRPSAGETLDLQRIVLQPIPTGGGILGTVRDFRTGVPIAGATVSIRYGITGGTRQVVTSANGQYFLGGLVSGFFILQAEAPGYRTSSAGVHVTPGSVSHRDIFLQR